MSFPGRRCFVAMPFRRELNFFFLYIQQHLRERWLIDVERGDAQVLTIPLIDKLKNQIAQADLVIADITGANANVLYEVGVAHTLTRPVLFLTQDPPEQVPVDVRQFEFIVYDLRNHGEFLSKLDNAIQNQFGAGYGELYAEAQSLLNEFNTATDARCAANNRDTFIALVVRGERAGAIPTDGDLRAEFLLPKIISDFTDSAVIRQYNAWITKRGSGAA
jgi:hypothetical protein